MHVGQSAHDTKSMPQTASSYFTTTELFPCIRLLFHHNRFALLVLWYNSSLGRLCCCLKTNVCLVLLLRTLTLSSFFTTAASRYILLLLNRNVPVSLNCCFTVPQLLPCSFTDKLLFTAASKLTVYSQLPLAQKHRIKCKLFELCSNSNYTVVIATFSLWWTLSDMQTFQLGNFKRDVYFFCNSCCSWREKHEKQGKHLHASQNLQGVSELHIYWSAF
jgi:hypothetical protein